MNTIISYSDLIWIQKTFLIPTQIWDRYEILIIVLSPTSQILITNMSFLIFFMIEHYYKYDICLYENKAHADVNNHVYQLICMSCSLSIKVHVIDIYHY